MEPLHGGLFGDSGKWPSFLFEAQTSILITLNYYYQQSQDIFPWLPVSQRKMAEKKREDDYNFSSKTLYSYIMLLFWRKRHSVKNIFSIFIEARDWQNTSKGKRVYTLIGHFLVTLSLGFKTSLHAKPFKWKSVWLARKWTCDGTHFQMRGFNPDTEAKSNSVVAFS